MSTKIRKEGIKLISVQVEGRERKRERGRGERKRQEEVGPEGEWRRNVGKRTEKAVRRERRKREKKRGNVDQ